MITSPTTAGASRLFDGGATRARRHLPVAPAFLLLLASPALALSTVTATKPDDALLLVTLTNGTDGSIDEVHTFDTEMGPVSVRHHTTSNGPNGCCPDVLEVVDMPPGTIARPLSLEVDEDTSGSIRIERYIGG